MHVWLLCIIYYYVWWDKLMNHVCMYRHLWQDSWLWTDIWCHMPNNSKITIMLSVVKLYYPGIRLCLILNLLKNKVRFKCSWKGLNRNCELESPHVESALVWKEMESCVEIQTPQHKNANIASFVLAVPLEII